MQTTTRPIIHKLVITVNVNINTVQAQQLDEHALHIATRTVINERGSECRWLVREVVVKLVEHGPVCQTPVAAAFACNHTVRTGETGDLLHMLARLRFASGETFEQTTDAFVDALFEDFALGGRSAEH